MSYIDFDAVDYIDDIDTKDLARELERRSHSVKGLDQLKEITELLMDAWETKNRVLFDKALLMLEPPEIAERRAFRIRETYAAAMAEKHTTH